MTIQLFGILATRRDRPDAIDSTALWDGRRLPRFVENCHRSETAFGPGDGEVSDESCVAAGCSAGSKVSLKPVRGNADISMN